MVFVYVCVRMFACALAFAFPKKPQGKKRGGVSKHPSSIVHLFPTDRSLVATCGIQKRGGAKDGGEGLVINRQLLMETVSHSASYAENFTAPYLCINGIKKIDFVCSPIHLSISPSLHPIIPPSIIAGGGMWEIPSSDHGVDYTRYLQAIS